MTFNIVYYIGLKCCIKLIHFALLDKINGKVEPVEKVLNPRARVVDRLPWTSSHKAIILNYNHIKYA